GSAGGRRGVARGAPARSPPRNRARWSVPSARRRAATRRPHPRALERSRIGSVRSPGQRAKAGARTRASAALTRTHLQLGRSLPGSGVPGVSTANDLPRAAGAPVLLLGLGLLPALLAMAALPGFITSDGPAHLYNAQIISDLWQGGREYGDVYEVRWAPLPHWGQYLLLLGLMQLVPPRAADRLAMVVTLVGFGASVLWLRWKVAGRPGLGVAALLSALLALNVPWLFGFTGFLLGACLFPLALGLWWGGRERFGPGRALAVGSLLVLQYFCHPVSLGLTGLGLLVLA